MSYCKQRSDRLRALCYPPLIRGDGGLVFNPTHPPLIRGGANPIFFWGWQPRPGPRLKIKHGNIDKNSPKA